MPDSHQRFPKIIALQYFLHFGVMGIFLPFFNLYCYQIGLDGVQIGVISSMRSVTTIFFPLIAGVLADRLKKTKPIYVGCCFAATFSWCGFFFTTDYIPMLVIAFVYGAFYAPLISFLEALTVEVLGPEKQSYGKVRVWGSISFICMVTVMGKIIGLFSESIIIVAIFGVSFVQSFLALKLPFRAPAAKPASGSGLTAFFDPGTIIFLASAFLMLTSHGAYYGFFSIHMKNLGYSALFTGSAWALGSGMEIFSMMASKKIFNHFSLEKVLIFSFFTAVVRWLMLFYVTSAPLIILSQLLHAITYGTFHMASILYIDRQSDAHVKNFGQGINNAVTYGLGLMVGFLLNGYCFELFGSQTLFLISSAIALLGGLIFSGYFWLGKIRNPGMTPG